MSIFFKLNISLYIFDIINHDLSITHETLKIKDASKQVELLYVRIHKCICTYKLI